MVSKPFANLQVAYLSSAWGRMFGAMGERLASYLPIAAEPVLVAAAVQPETMLLDGKFSVKQFHALFF